MVARRRILTGDRPTGKLHLGHYVGSLQHRVAQQEEYDCYFIIADLHSLTTRPEKEHIDQLRENIFAMVCDYLALGVDPERSTIFVQSALPETYELNLIFEMLVTLPRVARLPTIKEMARAALFLEDGEMLDTARLQPAISEAAAMPVTPTLKQVREQAEREHIEHVLEQCGGAVAAAAEVLGIGMSTLYARMKDLGITT